MPDEQERHRIEVDRADRQVIEQGRGPAAARAIRAGYAGMHGKHFAFALALVARRAGPAPARPASCGAGAGGATRSDAAGRVTARPRRASTISTGPPRLP